MKRGVGAIAGVVVIAAYATLMAVQALVLDPLAAVPGESLAQIHAHLAADGWDVCGDIVSVIVSSAIGVALAVAVAVFGVWRNRPFAMVIGFLLVLGGGAFATFGNGFELEMDVADSYGLGGESHTVWARVLYATSLLSASAVLILIARRRLRNRERPPRVPVDFSDRTPRRSPA